jgi:predicted nucleotidyltransferase
MLPLIKRQPGVVQVILFGSLASGEARSRSDLDIIILQKTTKRFMDRLDEFYRLLSPTVATDILIYTPAEWEDLVTTRPFIARARHEGKVLYAA